ncbi:MAG: ribosome biogenesis GTP-binding protein YihA/YsxC [Christensenellales bacterium]
MIVKKAKFVISQSDSRQCKDYGCPEIAVAGKSNVGKSSFINMLAGVGGLAKTSSTPGRTRLINYFDFNDSDFMLVDLPGYGFARVDDSEKKKWGSMIEGYLSNRFGRIACVLVLIDIRRTPDALDKQMVAYLHYYHLPFVVVATKGDKLSKAQQSRQRQIIASQLAIGADDVIVTSCISRQGKDEILNKIEALIIANRE